MAARDIFADEARDLRDRNIRGKGNINSRNFALTEKGRDWVGRETQD
jgi:hypothetical protein